MPSTAIFAAVAIGAGEAATALGAGTLLAGVTAAAAGATASTAINGGSWGEQFGLGLLGAGVASGLSSAVGSSLGTGIGEASAGSGASGSGIGEASGSGLGSSLGSSAVPGLEGSLGTGLASSSLEGAITPSFSSLGDALGSGAGSSAGTASGGFGSGLGMTVDSAGSSALGSGIGSEATSNSLASPSGVNTGEGYTGGGGEGFQNNSPLIQAPQTQPNTLGSGFYNSDPSQGLGFNGTSVTGGYSDLGSTALPNAGAEVVPDWQKTLQTAQNGLGSIWDAATSKNGLKTIAGLYDAYSRNQAAKMYKSQLDTLNNMYAPGSAEYNALQNKVDRQNAAAGRRGATLTNATNFANLIQQNRNAVLTNPSYLSTLNGYNQNKYGQLGSLFNVAGGMF